SVWGCNSSAQRSRRCWSASGSSPGMMGSSARSPCFKLFKHERALPASEVGPLLRLPLAMLAIRRASLVGRFGGVVGGVVGLPGSLVEVWGGARGGVMVESPRGSGRPDGRRTDGVAPGVLTFLNDRK